MRTVRHFILKKLYRIQFFVGGRLIIRSQALTHLRLKEIYVSGMNFYLDIVANHFFSGGCLAHITVHSILHRCCKNCRLRYCFWNQVGIWRVAGQLKMKEIFILVLYPIVVGLIMWADKLTNQRVIFFSDSESVVHVINK